MTKGSDERTFTMKVLREEMEAALKWLYIEPDFVDGTYSPVYYELLEFGREIRKRECEGR